MFLLNVSEIWFEGIHLKKGSADPTRMYMTISKKKNGLAKPGFVFVEGDFFTDSTMATHY